MPKHTIHSLNKAIKSNDFMSEKAVNSVNERLKILMEELHTTPAKLSRILETSDSTVRNYIYRDTKPGYDVIEKLYRSFRHINLYWLFGEPGEPLMPTAYTGVGDSVSNNKKITRSLVVGHVGRDANNNQGASASELAAAKREVELLKAQVADKDEIIQLLKARLPKP